MPCAINIDESGAVGAVNMERLNTVQLIITRTADFINNVMIPDALAIGQFNKPWSEIGTGFLINASSVTARSLISPTTLARKVC